jgi:hypothetical protein
MNDSRIPTGITATENPDMDINKRASKARIANSPLVIERIFRNGFSVFNRFL